MQNNCDILRNYIEETQMLDLKWQATYQIEKAVKAINFTVRWPRRRTIFIFLSLFAATLLFASIIWELRASWLQSRILARFASRLTFWLEPGPSNSIHFPGLGPYDKRTGYGYIGKFTDRLIADGYIIEKQARVSPRLAMLANRSISPIYHEKAQTGLCILDKEDQILFAEHYPRRIYETFDSIPNLVVRTLIFIENRELLDPRYPYRNPAVEWDRLAKACFDLALKSVHRDHDVAGGSTLATQLEKYKHSPEGRTSSPGEKLRQMTSAAFRAYLNGTETLPRSPAMARCTAWEMVYGHGM